MLLFYLGYLFISAHQTLTQLQLSFLLEAYNNLSSQGQYIAPVATLTEFR